MAGWLLVVVTACNLPKDVWITDGIAYDCCGDIKWHTQHDDARNAGSLSDDFYSILADPMRKKEYAI